MFEKSGVVFSLELDMVNYWCPYLKMFLVWIIYPVVLCRCLCFAESYLGVDVNFTFSLAGHSSHCGCCWCWTCCAVSVLS